MNKEALLRQIKRKAKQDEQNRQDRRFVETMGFLVAKGLLKTDLDVPLRPNQRLRIDDAVWAGQNVEPRILEVLPAAVLRLGKHFDFDRARHHELARVVDQLRRRERRGDPFQGMPYEKVKVWADFPLADRRVKPVAGKKIVKTFRLEPVVLERLKELARVKGCTETEVIEGLLK